MNLIEKTWKGCSRQVAALHRGHDTCPVDDCAIVRSSERHYPCLRRRYGRGFGRGVH